MPSTSRPTSSTKVVACSLAWDWRAPASCPPISTKPLPDPSPRYHRILLDAPCSGLGVLRRHPEALFRRATADLSALAAQQLQMLSVVAPTLLPGGLLVYAVCTFDRRECEDVVAAFLAAHPGFLREPAAAAGGRTPWPRLTDATGAVRTWPQRDGTDAFFAVRLRAPGVLTGTVT